ncbi:zinc finger, C3HC4 type [Opisthorchis viverrini]|uniref:Zinc finger, C3HC4 type n=1 Tax=Opisthorchis viverrini TaxID=6198 RepID=A0A1S8X3D8_OPIVI|nr:zinc finger, C3HC4 type [Opisthorchis viverrini]
MYVAKFSNLINVNAAPNFPYPFAAKNSLGCLPCSDFADLGASRVGKRSFTQLAIESYSLRGMLSPDFHLFVISKDLAASSMNELQPEIEAIEFRSGNPVVETTEGFIHVYKNAKEVGVTDSRVSSTMLCIFSVPSYLTVKDLLSFVAPMRDSVEELKVVKNGGPNHYMALLKFRSEQETDQFYHTYNNTCYRNLESEVCQLMYVSHVDKTHPAMGTAFPTKDLLELPSCPVCLERLDEPVQGILTTILCNHSFHDECIARVEDITCPVCRYMQSPELLDESQCADCCIRDNLWICLICGRIGCGRYGRKHAQLHFEQTGHTFALELGKNLVWDYADDAYVHRLAVNHEDGKLVQVGAGSETGDKKLDLMSMEFSAVLTSQLESQRAYFESQLERITTESAIRIQAAESKVEELSSTLNQVQQQLNELTKEKSSTIRKLQQATSLAQRLQKELEEERALNKSLLNNESIWRSRAEKAEAEAKTSKEECKELLLNLEFRSKLTEFASSEQLSSGELENCEISIQQHPNQPSSCRRRKKR